MEPLCSITKGIPLSQDSESLESILIEPSNGKPNLLLSSLPENPLKISYTKSNDPLSLTSIL